MKTESCNAPLRVLCISPLFAPAASAEGFCATKMVQGLQQAGVSVTLLSCSNLWGGSRQDGSRLWDSVRDLAVDLPNPVQPARWHSAWSAARFQTQFYARWVSLAVRTANRLHREKPFDLIYSRSLPTAAHVAGFWCAKQLQLPWVANMNDPWDFSLYPGTAPARLSPWATRSLLFWLRRTLRYADRITYPCKGLHEFHTALAGFEHPAEIIPHIGYKAEPSRPAGDDRFLLVHAGMLGSSDVTGRSTKALLLGFKAFVESSADATARIKLVLVGPEDAETQSLVRELSLQDHVENVGRVDYQDSLAHIASASACLLIEANMEESIFFPSKLADYLAAGRPVLALSPRKGLAADLAGRGELIRADSCDPEAIRASIAVLYSAFQRGTLSSHEPSAKLSAQLQSDSVVKQFLEICAPLTSQKRVGLSPAGKKPLPEAKSLFERAS